MSTTGHRLASISAMILASCGRYGFDPAGSVDAEGIVDTRDGAVPERGVISVAGGTEHTCAVLHDGTLWCWGLNTEGQLGQGDTMTRTVPTRVGTDLDWSMVAAGGAGSDNGHTCALRRDGSLWCWGLNSFGQLGYSGANLQVPLQIGTETWSTITAGWLHSCGIRTDGSLWCWGDNGIGQLGQGDLSGRPPSQVGTRTDWIDVTSGLRHACALAADHTAWCWGDNTDGEVGAGRVSTSEPTPVQLPGADYAYIAALGQHSCATKLDGTLWCWGDNREGEVGTGQSTTTYLAPVMIGSATVVGGTASGTSALAGEQLLRWGNDAGFTMSTVPALASTAERWRSLMRGANYHACAVTIDGRLFCWGTNSAGQLGLGDTDLRYDPAVVPIATL